jgi:hypothetical protein
MIGSALSLVALVIVSGLLLPVLLVAFIAARMRQSEKKGKQRDFACEHEGLLL